ncbi:MAG: hypothetical protein HOG49_19035 [Candidatus Scalindua sp.]|jgi:hypothetical protein|nr:hypothetical protein [Candidatus Scalindua sp.]
MNKSRKYYCGLLVFVVIALFSFTSVNASDNFVKISLPKGVSIELPKDWIVLSEDQRITIDTIAESGLDLAGIEHENLDMPFSANYYKNGKTVGIIQIRYYPNLDLTQNDSRQATLRDINELNTTLKENAVKSLPAIGMSVLSWTGTKKTIINGITAFVTEYHRKGIKGSGAFRVRLIRVYAVDRSFTLIVSYDEEESLPLEIITDRIICSLRLPGISDTSVDEKQDSVFDINSAVYDDTGESVVTQKVATGFGIGSANLGASQVYAKPTSSNPVSLMSHLYGAWLIMLVLLALGLTPPLLIRLLIVRRPIGKWWAIGTAVGFFIINIFLFAIIELSVRGTLLIIQAYPASIIVAVVSYFILRKKQKHKSQRGKQNTKKKAVKIKSEKVKHVVYSKSPIIRMKEAIETGVSPCPNCSQLNTHRRTTCKNCGTTLIGYCPQCKAPLKYGEYCSVCSPNKKADPLKSEPAGTEQKADTFSNLELDFINDKTVRYIAIGIGVAITLALLYINDYPLFQPRFPRYVGTEPLPASYYGFFASKIEHSKAFKILYRSISIPHSKEIAYYLWLMCFGGGVFLSWKYRFKTAKVIIKVIRTIHKNA